MAKGVIEALLFNTKSNVLLRNHSLLRTFFTDPTPGDLCIDSLSDRASLVRTSLISNHLFEIFGWKEEDTWLLSNSLFPLILITIAFVFLVEFRIIIGKSNLIFIFIFLLWEASFENWDHRIIKVSIINYLILLALVLIYFMLLIVLR